MEMTTWLYHTYTRIITQATFKHTVTYVGRMFGKPPLPTNTCTYLSRDFRILWTITTRRYRRHAVHPRPRIPPPFRIKKRIRQDLRDNQTGVKCAPFFPHDGVMTSSEVKNTRVPHGTARVCHASS